MSQVKIVTDSACDIPKDLAEAKGITVVPLSIRFGDQEFVDRVDLSIDEFWTKTAASEELSSTAAPSPGAFEQAFKDAAGSDGSAVVCVTLASKLSATYQAAVTAAKMLEGAVDVRVVDSETCTVAEGSLCLEACDVAASGASADEVVAAVEKLRSRIKLMGTLDTLENLRKGGRIGAAGAFFASLLSVKPVITVDEGEVKPVTRARTRSKALAALANLVIESAPVDHVAISHSDAPDVKEFLELLRPVVDVDKVLVTDIGSTIGVHGGPRLIAVSYATDKAS